MTFLSDSRYIASVAVTFLLYILHVYIPDSASNVSN